MAPELRQAVGTRVRDAIDRVGRSFDRLRGLLPGTEVDRGAGADDEGERVDDTIAALEAEAELVRYRPEAADFDAVIDGLGRSDTAAREVSARALANAPARVLSRATPAVPALARCLDDDRLTVRRYSARALARIAPEAPDAIRDVAPTLVDHLSAHNLRVSRNVATALAEAASSHPEEVAPLVFDYVGAGVRARTRRNALVVVERAARTSPASVEPIVPALVDLVDRGLGDRSSLARTLAAVAEEAPGLVAPAVPALVNFAEDDDGAGDAIEALARLATADPEAARPAVPVLTRHLTREEPVHGDLAAASLVRIVDRHPDERGQVLGALEDADGMDRLRAARALAATGDLGKSIADEAMEESPLRRYLGR